MLPGHHDLAPVAQYLDVDDQGRLAAVRAHVTGLGTHQEGIAATYQVVDGPKGPVHDVPAPSSAFKGLVWDPSFTSDDRLLWPGPRGNGAEVCGLMIDI